MALALPRITSADSPDDYYEITADFNGDGITDTAISDPLHTFGNAGGRFTFYLGTTNGEPANVGTVFMHPLAASLKTIKPGMGALTVYVRGGPSGHLINYIFTAGGIEKTTAVPLSPNAGGPQGDQELYSRYFGPDARLKAIRMKKNPQQGGPAYPPQGVGSADP